MKYKLGDKVWVLYQNKIREFIILQRTERMTEHRVRQIPTYCLNIPGKYQTVTEDQIFSTKQELIDSL